MVVKRKPCELRKEEAREGRGGGEAEPELGEGVEGEGLVVLGGGVIRSVLPG